MFILYGKEPIMRPLSTRETAYFYILTAFNVGTNLTLSNLEAMLPKSILAVPDQEKMLNWKNKVAKNFRYSIEEHPLSTLPCHVLSCPTLPCLALPCPALPCLALPCPALPCPTQLSPALRLYPALFLTLICRLPSFHLDLTFSFIHTANHCYELLVLTFHLTWPAVSFAVQPPALSCLSVLSYVRFPDLLYLAHPALFRPALYFAICLENKLGLWIKQMRKPCCAVALYRSPFTCYLLPCLNHLPLFFPSVFPSAPCLVW